MIPAEIADLKRQLAVSAVDVMEAVLEMMGYGLPQDEPIDIRLVRKSLDAYVQEKLDWRDKELIEFLKSSGEWEGSLAAEMLESFIAINRAKVKT